MKASPAVRGLRATVFAVLCVLLAAGGHALATGMAPPVWVQAAGFVPVFAGAWLLGGREWSLLAIGGATLVAQGALHLAFGIVRPRAATAVPGQGAPARRGTRAGAAVHGVRGPHVVHSHTTVSHTMGAHAMASHTMRAHAIASHHMAAHALTPHATAAHVSAAVLLTWWLRRGEAALFSLLRRAATLVPGLAAWWRVRRAARYMPAVPRRARPAAAGPRTLRPTLLRHAVQRRGPPAMTAYAV
ncbi:hypothetical protein [Streptomyces sp. NPDC050287]|uniref:hypothetical protein n=1 Tax=Streptomyces sp. NPDC050287 TaxID=3365608 RepID=UPI00379D3C21